MNSSWILPLRGCLKPDNWIPPSEGFLSKAFICTSEQNYCSSGIWYLDQSKMTAVTILTERPRVWSKSTQYTSNFKVPSCWFLWGHYHEKDLYYNNWVSVINMSHRAVSFLQLSLFRGLRTIPTLLILPVNNWKYNKQRRWHPKVRTSLNSLLKSEFWHHKTKPNPPCLSADL